MLVVSILFDLFPFRLFVCSVALFVLIWFVLVVFL